MRLAVLVKQVPATHQVRMDEETGTMVRNAVEAELNPLDTYAVEEAVRTKERLCEESEVTVLSMGPSSAVEAIREAISMGCQKGYLLSDKRFAGADTWATAYALAAAIKKLGRFDLVFTGERATDGETGQVGPSIAAQLQIPAITYVSRIEDIGEGRIRLERSVEGGHEVVESPLPALLSVIKEINQPRVPNFKGKMIAKKTKVLTLTADDIECDPDKTGLKGSPTRVVKIFRPRLSRNCKIIATDDPVVAADHIIQFLISRGFVRGYECEG